jgi:hypothetical protein
LQINDIWAIAAASYLNSITIGVAVSKNPLSRLRVPYQCPLSDDPFGEDVGLLIVDESDVVPIDLGGELKALHAWVFKESMLKRVDAGSERQSRLRHSRAGDSCYCDQHA